MENISKTQKNIKLLFNKITLLVILLVLVTTVSAYDINPPSRTVHQYLTNESQVVWKLIPYEIKKQFNVNSIEADNKNSKYNTGDKIINGSSEEDF
ncbi:MAG TPA: hypothetical protein VJB08_03330 [Candidatus Nanoarchaeia archaeon]|nr:hypothetical protein [Candidatus Nanoarchaeia archaeon]